MGRWAILAVIPVLDELEWLRGSSGADLFLSSSAKYTPMQCMVADRRLLQIRAHTALNIVDVRSIAMHQIITQGQFCSGAARLFLLKQKQKKKKKKKKIYQ